jgi:hypothetical protein
MTVVYVIIIYGMLHNVESVLPGSFPDMNSCQAQVLQTHVTFGNYASCEPLANRPTMKGHKGHGRHQAHGGG